MVTKITNMKKSLKKYVLTTILLCSVLQILPAENRPRITIIATGGTIAGYPLPRRKLLMILPDFLWRY